MGLGRPAGRARWARRWRSQEADHEEDAKTCSRDAEINTVSSPHVAAKGTHYTLARTTSQVQGLASRRHHRHMGIPKERHVAPTDERVGIVILDWYRFALEAVSSGSRGFKQTA